MLSFYVVFYCNLDVMNTSNVFLTKEWSYEMTEVLGYIMTWKWCDMNKTTGRFSLWWTYAFEPQMRPSIVRLKKVLLSYSLLPPQKVLPNKEPWDKKIILLLVFLEGRERTLVGFRIFKSAVSQEQLGQSAYFFACWYRLKESKSWIENL